MSAGQGFRLTAGQRRTLVQSTLTLVALGLAGIFYRPALLLVLPGLLIVSLLWKTPPYLSDFMPAVVGTSLAFWVVSFWLVPYLGLPLSVWAYAVLLLSACLWAVSLWVPGITASPRGDRQEIFPVALLLIAAALRFSLFWRWPLAPAGGDMTMHGYMAALIVTSDSVPTTHRPLLPIDGFGAYPAGFQTLIALTSLLGDLPVYRSALFIEVSTLSLLTWAFYSVLRISWDRHISAVVALLVTFIPRNPQAFIQWGGDPTLLALAFLLLALPFLTRLRQRLRPTDWGVVALFIAASILTHFIPVMGFCYAVIPLVIYLSLRQRDTWASAARPVLRNLLGIGMFSALLLSASLPRLLSMEVSAAEVEWVRRFQQEWSGGAWGGTVATALVTIPSYLIEKVFGGSFLTLSALGLIFLALRQPGLGLMGAIFVLTVVGLIINSMYWLLPLSYALYPERVALLLLLPGAFGVAALLDGLSHIPVRRWVAVGVMAALILWRGTYHQERLLYKQVIPNVLLTQADLRAMQWIQEQTKPDAVFRNQYGDAGLWIPAIAFRAITDPHLSPFYFDEFRTASASLQAQYVYIGKRKALGEPIALDEFESAPETYQKVYEHDGVIIYEIIN